MPCGSSAAQLSRSWVPNPSSVTVTAIVRDAVLTGKGSEVGWGGGQEIWSHSQKTDWALVLDTLLEGPSLYEDTVYSSLSLGWGPGGSSLQPAIQGAGRRQPVLRSSSQVVERDGYCTQCYKLAGPRVLCSLGWPGICYVADNDLELLIFHLLSAGIAGLCWRGNLGH